MVQEISAPEAPQERLRPCPDPGFWLPAASISICACVLTRPTNLPACRGDSQTLYVSYRVRAGRTLSPSAGTSFQAHRLARAANRTAGLGRRQPADRCAPCRAPGRISRRHVAAGRAMLNRRLWEAGIFVIRDDPQGRRYKYRDERTGRLTKAFGFDLSPLVRATRNSKKSRPPPRSNATACASCAAAPLSARRGIDQALEELGAQGHDSEALRQLHRDAADLVVAARACRRSDELEVAVKALERRERSRNRWFVI